MFYTYYKNIFKNIKHNSNYLKNNYILYFVPHTYRDGIGVKQSDKKANKLYEMAAKRGNAAAQNNLANSYYRGTCGLTQLSKRSIAYYTLAAEQGLARAQLNLGTRCIVMVKVRVLKHRILKLENGLTKAAAQGNKLAINALKQLDKAGV